MRLRPRGGRPESDECVRGPAPPILFPDSENHSSFPSPLRYVVDLRDALAAAADDGGERGDGAPLLLLRGDGAPTVVECACVVDARAKTVALLATRAAAARPEDDDASFAEGAAADALGARRLRARVEAAEETEGVQWLLAAADAGDARAWARLGVLRARGPARGAPFARDLDQAESWLRAAGERGDADALFALALLVARRGAARDRGSVGGDVDVGGLGSDDDGDDDASDESDDDDAFDARFDAGGARRAREQRAARALCVELHRGCEDEASGAGPFDADFDAPDARVADARARAVVAEARPAGDEADVERELARRPRAEARALLRRAAARGHVTASYRLGLELLRAGEGEAARDVRGLALARAQQLEPEAIRRGHVTCLLYTSPSPRD